MQLSLRNSNLDSEMSLGSTKRIRLSHAAHVKG